MIALLVFGKSGGVIKQSFFIAPFFAKGLFTAEVDTNRHAVVSALMLSVVFLAVDNRGQLGARFLRVNNSYHYEPLLFILRSQRSISSFICSLGAVARK